MSITRSDSRIENHNKPVTEGERKLSGGAYIDYATPAEVTAAVPVEYRKNKYYWIAGVLNHCGSDGTTFRTTGINAGDLGNYTLKTDFNVLNHKMNDHILTPRADKAATAVTGYISRTDGHLVLPAENAAAANWLATDFLPVNDLTIIEWNNVNLFAVPAALFCFYNASKVFMSQYSPDPSGAAITLTVSSRQVGAQFVRCSGRHVGADPFHVYDSIQIRQDAVDGLPALVTSVNTNTSGLAAVNTKVDNLPITRDYVSEPGITNGYTNLTGVYTANANYRCTDYIGVVQGQELNYSGVSGTTTTPIAYFDSNKVYLSAPLASNATYTNSKVIVPTGVSYVRMNSRASGGDIYNFKLKYYPSDPKIIGRIDANTTSITANTAAIAATTTRIDNLFTLKDYGTANLQIGYIGTTGAFVANSIYVATDFVPVKQGYPMQYQGNSGSAVIPVAYYNAAKTYLSSGLAFGNYATVQNLTVPANSAIAYVRMSARTQAGDTHVFNIGNIVDVPASSTASPPTFFIPPVAYGRQSELFRLYFYGCMAKNPADQGTDIWCDLVNTNQNFWEMTPTGSDDNIVATVYTRDDFQKDVTAGTVTLKVTHTTKNPATPVNIICIGDSVTFGVNSTIEGDGPWVNELSRRLTGTGYAIPASPSPTALSLTGIYIRGTLGTKPAKHEGRGGWSLDDYLRLANKGAVTNAFWNAATSKFDLAYYLNANSFNAAQTTNGVDATGSNLVIYLFLGWNDTNAYGVDQAGIYLNEMLDIIHTSHTNAKIKLLGLTAPPPLWQRFASGFNSAQWAMTNKIIPLAKKWQSIADARSTYVEFVPQAPFFNAEESFGTWTKKLHSRSNTNITIYNDYVHPVDPGYGQIADIVFYNFLYNYCRLT